MTNTKKAGAAVAVGVATLGTLLLVTTPDTPQWPRLRVEWDANPAGNCDGYEVWHGTNFARLNDVEMLGETTNEFFAWQGSQYGFVTVRAFKTWGTNRIYSQWAIRK